MTNTRKSLLDLPLDVINYKISPGLQDDLKNINNLNQSCKMLNRLFSPQLKEVKETSQLLKHVMKGEQDQAEKIIKESKDTRLLLRKTQGIDFSKRMFKHITVFQYALWALDKHMWMMLLNYLPKEEAAKQLAQLEDSGTDHGTHYDFMPLIMSMEKYINFSNWSWNNLPAINHFTQEIGALQRLVPAHVVNEYCYPGRSFQHVPEFKENHLPRQHHFYDYSIKAEVSWFQQQENMSAIFRGVNKVAAFRMLGWLTWPVQIDVAALKQLSKVRNNNFIQLKQQLIPDLKSEKPIRNYS